MRALSLLTETALYIVIFHKVNSNVMTTAVLSVFILLSMTRLICLKIQKNISSSLETSILWKVFKSKRIKEVLFICYFYLVLYIVIKEMEKHETDNRLSSWKIYYIQMQNVMLRSKQIKHYKPYLYLIFSYTYCKPWLISPWVWVRYT